MGIEQPGAPVEVYRISRRCGALRRRDFLAWISALVVAPSMERICHAATTLDAPALGSAGRPYPLGVGYLEGSDGWDLGRDAPPLAGAVVLPARELAGGDVDLALGRARLTIRGLYPEILAPGVFDWMELSVLFPAPVGERPEDLLRYLAWSYDETPVVNLGASNRFDVPLGVDGSLPLALDTGFPDSLSQGGAAVSYFADFTVDSDPQRPKLRRGAYLLALAGDPWPGSQTLPKSGEEPSPELLSLLMTVEDGSIPPAEDDNAYDGGNGPPDPDDSGPGECGAGADRVVAGETVSSLRHEAACRSLSSHDYRVLGGGDVTFRSPSISLGEGFEVGGRFEAGS